MQKKKTLSSTLTLIIIIIMKKKKKKKKKVFDKHFFFFSDITLLLPYLTLPIYLLFTYVIIVEKPSTPRQHDQYTSNQKRMNIPFVFAVTSVHF